MKVSLIISAPIADSYGFNVLASQIKKVKCDNFELKLFYVFYDFNKLYPEKVIKELVDLCVGSDLIGISLLSSAFRNSVQITNELKKSINCPIIWGGKHPTCDPDECIKHADIIALSEGEDTLVELVQRINDGQPYDDIAGLWIRKSGGQIIKNNLRELETNLDKFLFPDYSVENKFVLDLSLMNIRPMVKSDMNDMVNRYPTMITRGCPNCCTFCTNSTDLRLRNMRSRSVDNVIAEVKEFMKIFPETRRIMFRDDCITAMPLSFIEEFKDKWKREINLPCGVSGVIATSDDFRKKLEILTDAGMKNFKMGIQSGCEKIRRQVFARVGETNEVIKRATKDLHDVVQGKINYYMITDNPYENEDELIESIRFTSRIIRPFSLSLYSLNFYPGTALFNRALNDGNLKSKEDALLESTMDFSNTYLNKVFIALRHFEIPPFLIDFLTSKKLYKNKIYQSIFGFFFKLFFRSDVPNRKIRKPSLRGELSKAKHGKIPDLLEVARWFLWEPFELLFIFYHRNFIK